MSLFRVSPPGGKVRDIYGSVIGNVRTLIDYTQDETIVDRYACLLQVYDYTNGSLDTIAINPSDTASTTWTENTDFNATTSNAQTASNIASAINSTTDFSAEAVTGIPYDPYVSISYIGGGYIDSASSGDTTAWEMQAINATNGTIAEIASDGSGTRKNQPVFTDSDGFWEFYIDNKGRFDLLFDKSGVTFDNSRYEDISASPSLISNKFVRTGGEIFRDTTIHSGEKVYHQLSPGGSLTIQDGVKFTVEDGGRLQVYEL